MGWNDEDEHRLKEFQECYERGESDGIREERERTERQKSISADLWKLLDEIDTASDVFKTNYEGLAKYVYHTQRKRFAIMSGEEFEAIRSAKENGNG